MQESQGSNGQVKQSSNTSNSLCVRYALIALVLSCLVLAACSNAPQGESTQPPIPSGFSHSEGTIEEGFVIADAQGNEFVWIPADRAIRYDFDHEKEIDDDDAIGRVYYGEGRKEAVTFGTDYDITHFKDSIAQYGGFYFARYETGDAYANQPRQEAVAGEPVSRPSAWPFTYITRDDALEASKAFPVGEDAVCTLASSYAWDLAMLFIGQDNWTQQAENKERYSADSSATGAAIAQTGESVAAKNIFDLYGNACEWTTEYSSNAYYDYHDDCVYRGTSFADGWANPTWRGCNVNVANEFTGFRMVIYLQEGR